MKHPSNSPKPAKIIDSSDSAAITTGIGLALCAMLNGARAKRPKVKLPVLADCPFCGSKAELRYTPLPSIGCTNDECAIKPAVTYAYALFKGIKANTAKGLKEMARVWNTRAPGKKD